MEDNFLDFGDLGAVIDDSPIEVATDPSVAETETKVVQGDGLQNVTPTTGAAATAADGNKEDLIEIELKGETDLPEVDVKETVKAGDLSPVGGNLAADLARAFTKDGILTASEEDIKKVKTLSDFTELMKKTISSNELDGLGEEGKQLVEAIRNGMPLERAAAIHNHTVALEKITEDAYTDSPDDAEDVLEQKKGLRYNLIKSGYIAQGMDEAKATRLAERSFKLEEDVTDAADMHEVLKAAAKSRLANEAKDLAEKRKEQDTKIANLKKSISSHKEILPGIPVDAKMAKEIADMVTTPTGRDQKTNTVRWAVTDKRNENQERFDTRLAYLIKMGLFDDKPDMSVFNKVKTSSAIQELEKSIGGKSIDISGGRGFSAFNTDPSEYDVLDHIKL